MSTVRLGTLACATLIFVFAGCVAKAPTTPTASTPPVSRKTPSKKPSTPPAITASIDPNLEPSTAPSNTPSPSVSASAGPAIETMKLAKRVQALAADATGNLYAMSATHIYKVAADGTMTEVAGGLPAATELKDANGAEARFKSLRNITVDADGNLLVTDANAIRKVTPAGVVTTIAGTYEAGNANGKAADARFSSPDGLVVDSKKNVFIADAGNLKVRMLGVDGTVEDFYGTGLPNKEKEPFLVGNLDAPARLGIDENDGLYLTQTNKAWIVRIRADRVGYVVPVEPKFNDFRDVHVGAGGVFLLGDPPKISDTEDPPARSVRYLKDDTGTTKLLVDHTPPKDVEPSPAVFTPRNFGVLSDLAAGPNRTLYVLDLAVGNESAVWKIRIPYLP